MNFKRLLYPLDGIEATMSEHIFAHKLAVMLWLVLIGTLGGWAILYFWVLSP